MAIDMILGTAGHIDHGKTSLVRALTGVDTDRLPEEKRRGITIELGFAPLNLGDYHLGIVDVPGHERFVRQMLSGATGMDLALLVVAADDSVKPQTLEHFDVLRMLDLKAGVIALTKCDLVEPDWADLVEEEVRELVAGSFLQQAPIIRTSVSTGLGIDQLKRALHDAASAAAGRIQTAMHDAPFRMAIDRCFPVEGHGTVVTGSVSSGHASTGDELVVLPQGIKVRVRGIHHHDQPVSEVHRGQRAAVNLAGVRHDEVAKGFELATPGHLWPTRCVTAVFDLLESAPRAIKHRARIRLHVGTSESLAALIVLDDPREMQPGQRRVVQFLLREPITVVWNQPFIVRAESPVVTIGGGRILVPHTHRLRRLDEPTRRAFEQLQLADPLQRAAAATQLMGLTPWQPADLVRMAGIDDFAAVTDELLEREICDKLSLSAHRQQIVHRDVIQDWVRRLCHALETLHAAHPLKLELDRSLLLSQFPYVAHDGLLAAILEHMQALGIVRMSNTGIALRSNELQLSPEQQRLQALILEQFQAARFQPPTVTEFAATQKVSAAEARKLFQLGAATGELIHITGEMYLHRDAELEMRTMLKPRLQEAGLTLSQIREMLGTTRKYAVPFCEYLDRVGFTKRKGDLRVLA